MALNANFASVELAEASGRPDGAQSRSQGPGAPRRLRQGGCTQLPGPGGPHPPCWRRLCSSSRRPPMARLRAPGLPARRSCCRRRQRRRRRPRHHPRRLPRRSRQYSSQRGCPWRSRPPQALATWSRPWLPPRLPLCPSPWPLTGPQARPHSRLQLPPWLSHRHLRPRPSRSARAGTGVPAQPGPLRVRMARLEMVLANVLQLL